MIDLGSTVFDTAIGVCGLVWGPGGIVAVQLPNGDIANARARLSRRFAGAPLQEPPAAVRRVVDAIGALLSGEPIDLGFATVDQTGAPAFNLSVYALTRAIPAGETRTYGDLARDLGGLQHARAVGRALGENPTPIIVPCHRVLGANGGIGGFSAPGGVNVKAQILSIERARTGGAPTLFDSDETFSLAPRRR